MKRVGLALATVIALTIIADRASAAIVFADFNTNETPFTGDPNDSGTSVGDNTNSTANRVITNSPREGIGHQELILNHDGSATALRIRHLAGGGSPTGQQSFTTTGATDGWIGFWLKTSVAGMETSINLDGPANSTAQMRGSTSVAINPDGQWHLYEWNLDATNWGSVPGIVTHTAGALPNNTYTIDSIYIRDLAAPSPSGTYYLDFVAKSDSNSIAGITPAAIPEASSFLAVGLAGLSALGVVWSRRKRAAVQQAA